MLLRDAREIGAEIEPRFLLDVLEAGVSDEDAPAPHLACLYGSREIVGSEEEEQGVVALGLQFFPVLLELLERAGVAAAHAVLRVDGDLLEDEVAHLVVAGPESRSKISRTMILEHAGHEQLP